MKKLIGLTLLAATFAAPAMADCAYPKAPAKIPEGETASLEDMQAGVKAVKEYDTAMKAYQACLQGDQAALEAKIAKDNGGQISDEQKKKTNEIFVQKSNAADDELQAVAARLNEQIRLYKAKHPSK
jgi:Skp family chaperone for outer membrane proteins